MMGGHSTEQWVVFHLIVFGLLALDLGVFNRKAHVVKLREALGWSLFWILISMAFAGWIWQTQGEKAGFEYITGYVVEKSLSVDNLFVFLVIFRAFKIEKMHQHRLLFWGILGAIALRAVMVAAGAALLNNFHWVIYVFGAFLLYTGFHLLREGDDKMDPRNGRVIRTLRKFLPFTDGHYPGHFTAIENGKRKLTLSFAALVVVEASDVLFALDSVPAVFGVTRDPYIVYTSNIFAILGLRSLFFVLEDFMDRFHLLKHGLAIILMAVGTKMVIEPWVHVPPHVGLGFILLILVGAIVLSLALPPKSKE